MSTSVSTPVPEATKSPKTVRCPFSIVVDSREQSPYLFANLWSGPAGRSPRLVVPTVREALTIGDYAIFGHPRCAIERKSKEDLYASVSQRRENFVGRLERMCRECIFAAVVVEAEWSEILTNPPRHTQFSPKSLCRTIQAWMLRYALVHWVFAPSRDHAEAFTFRLLERYWKDRQALNAAGGWSPEVVRSWDAELVVEAGEGIESTEATATTESARGDGHP